MIKISKPILYYSGLFTLCMMAFSNTLYSKATRHHPISNHVQEKSIKASQPTPFWQGHAIYGGTGLHYKRLLPQTKTFLHETGPLIEIGWAWHKVFKQSWYWGIEAMFTYFYPDFSTDKVLDASLLGIIPDLIPLPSYWLWIIPIAYVHIGYINRHQTLFSLGSVYLWGLVGTVKHPLSKNFFIQGQGVWFLDKAFFGGGLHDAFLKVGIGYKF